MTIYAAYDEYAVFGLGNTPAAAIQDATEWCEDLDGLKIANASAGLVGLVGCSGGNVGIYLAGETLITRAELDLMH